MGSFSSGRGGARDNAGAPKKDPDLRTVKTSVSIPRGMRDRLDDVSARQGISRGKLIVEAIEFYLDSV